MENYKHWTLSACECYKRGGVCKGCIYEKFFINRPYKCKMKESVRILVKNLGLPPQIEGPGVYDEDDEY